MPEHKFVTASLFFGLLAASTPVLAQTPAPPPLVAASPQDASGSQKWEPDIAKFEAADRVKPPPQGAVLFIGASSIRKWTTLTTDFPGIPTINRGFGGSLVQDSTYFADRIVFPYHPRRIVFFGGDNDLAAGHTPEQVAADTQAFVAKVRSVLPDVPIVLLSIKPSPSRMKLHDKQLEANRLIAAFAAQAKDVTFVDVYTPMIGADGRPVPDLFGPDRLHMTPKGYALWTKIAAPYVK